MRIAVYSDLHLEFKQWTPPPGLECDIVVLAGDIHQGDAGLIWASQHFDVPVIYVPGNHEYYGSDISTTNELLRKTSRELGIHLLLDDVVEIENIYFVGATLWTDFNLLDNAEDAVFHAQRKLEDFKCIRILDNENQQLRRLEPQDTIEIHRKSVSCIQKVVEQNPDKKVVVITHHSPSDQSTPPMFKGNYLSPAFSSNLEAFIVQKNITLWIHGHTHHCVDYKLGNTRVVSNQRGYQPFELNKYFSDCFVVKV